MANVKGNNGNNALVGTNNDDKMNGKGGNDVLIGKDGNDNIKGGGGNDLLIGNDGNDTLEGGSGNDTLIGHAGQDVFKLDYKLQGRDLILDFTKGQDAINIKGIKPADIGFVDRYDSSLSNKVQYASNDGCFYGDGGIFAQLSRSQALCQSDFL